MITPNISAITRVVSKSMRNIAYMRAYFVDLLSFYSPFCKYCEFIVPCYLYADPTLYAID